MTDFLNSRQGAMNVARETAPGRSCSENTGAETGASEKESSRRKFIRAAAGGALAGLVAARGMEFAAPRSVLAQSILSPDEALKELMDGNRRFAAGNITAFAEDLQILRDKTVEKQEPFAAVLSCADSRVPVEIAFDESIGHIFVTRVAGNMVTPEIIASLEYGAAVLGTKVILVMGHRNCGAVKATIQAAEVPGQISALYQHIMPAVNQAGHDLEAATKANAKIQAALLREASTVIAGLVKDKKLKVVAGYFDVGSGIATLLE